MIDYFKDKKVSILTLEYDGVKIFNNKNSKHYSIDELEKIIFQKFGINIKLSFKNIEDHFDQYGIRCNTDDINKKIL